MKQSADFRVRKTKLKTKRHKRLKRHKKIDGLNMRSFLAERLFGFKLNNFLKSTTGKLILLALVMLVFVIFLYTFFLSDRFKTKTVLLYEGDSVSTNTSFQKVASQFRGRQLLTITKGDILENYLLNGVKLQSLEIEKNYPGTLVIRIQPLPIAYRTVFITNSEEQLADDTFAMNTAGVLVNGDLNDTIPLLEIVPLAFETPKKGDEILESNEVQTFQKVTKAFIDEIGLNVKKVRFLQTARELHILTERDTWIWFDLTYDPLIQVQKLKDAVAEIQLFSKDYAHIDLRIPGQNNQRIYYLER